MSQSQVEGRLSTIKRTPTVITRNSGVRTSTSMGSRPNISAGTMQALSTSGIGDIKGNRQKEKKDLQDLNGRLAGYIEKVRFLEANCQRLENENQALRNRKMPDLEPIKKAFENELAQARQTIDDLHAAKGESDTKVVGLEQELADLREINNTLEKHLKDYKKKVDSYNSQIGEYEGELATLRHRVNSLEEENNKLRELLNKVQDQNKKLRCDLDAETMAHIEADGHYQTKLEEAQFYKDLLDEFELLKQEPLDLKTTDYSEFWKSEMQKALREINSAYDDKLETLQMDLEAKYNTKIDALKAGNLNNNMSAQRAKDDVTRLKSQLAEKNSLCAELATKLAALQAEKDELSRQLAESEREFDALKLKYDTDVGELQDELSSVLAQLQTLMDAKMSLELEIACYKKLLEGEETRVGLKSMVEDALGSQEKGSVHNAIEAALKEQSTLKESTGSLTVQRSSKGPLAFKSMDHSGGNIVIENTSTGARAKVQGLKNWRLVKNAAGRNTVDIALKDYDLASGKTFTLWARGAKEKASEDNEQVADNFSFGVGTCKWMLLDDSNAEKATLNARFTG